MKSANQTLTMVTDERSDSWKLVPIKDVADINPKLDKSAIPDKLLVSFVPMQAVGAGDGAIDVSNLRSAAEVKKGFTNFQEGDVLFAKITPCMENGKMAIVPKVASGYGFGSTEFHVLRPKDSVDSRYLYYFVSSQSVRKEAAHNMTGAVGQKRVATSYIADLEIPLAPPDQQRLVVAEIEKQSSRLDEAVANLKRVKANLKHYKAAVLNAACMGKIGDVNRQAWSETTLGAVASKIRNGYSLKPDAEQGTRIFRISAVRPLALALNDVRYLSRKISDYADFQVTPGDILFTRYNGNPDFVGVCAVVPDRCPPTIHPDKLIRVKVPDTILLPQMLAILASAGESRAFLKQRIRTTAGQAGISGTDLKAMPVSVPPIAEQRRIVAEVDRLLSTTTEIETQVTVNLIRAERLRQSILKEAFFGQIRH